MPATVRPGDQVAIYTDLPDGTVRVVQRTNDPEVVQLKVTSAHSLLLYRFSPEAPEGEYLITFSGPGGTWGEAAILVARDVKP